MGFRYSICFFFFSFSKKKKKNIKKKKKTIGNLKISIGSIYENQNTNCLF